MAKMRGMFNSMSIKRGGKKYIINDSDPNLSGSTNSVNLGDTGELSGQTALASNSDMSSRPSGFFHTMSIRRKSNKESKKHISDSDSNLSGSTSIHSVNSSDTGEQLNNGQTTEDLKLNVTLEPPPKPKKTKAEAIVEDIGKLINRLMTYEEYAINNKKNEIEQSIIFYQSACSVIGELAVGYFRDTLSDDRIEGLVKALGSNLEQVRGLLLDSEKRKAYNYILAKIEARLKGFYLKEIPGLDETENNILELVVTKALSDLQGKSIDSSKVIETIMKFLGENLKKLKDLKEPTNQTEDFCAAVERFEKIVSKTKEYLNSNNCPSITRGSTFSGLSEEEKEAVSNAANESAKSLIQRIEQRTVEAEIIVFIKDIIDDVTTLEFDDVNPLLIKRKIIPQEQFSQIYAVLKPYLDEIGLDNLRMCKKSIKEIVSLEIGKLGKFVGEKILVNITKLPSTLKKQEDKITKLIEEEKAKKPLADKIANIQEDPSVEPETTSGSTDGLETIAAITNVVSKITNFIESDGMLAETAVNSSSTTEYVLVKTRVEAGIDKSVKIGRQLVGENFLLSMLAEELKWEDGAVVDTSLTTKVGDAQLLQHEPKYGQRDNSELLENPLISEDGLYRRSGAYSASPDDYEVGTMGNSVPDDCINL